MDSVGRRSSSNKFEPTHAIELTPTSGRPVRVVGTEIGEVVTREGPVIRVYRTRSGRRVLHRFIDSCWGGHSDVLVVEGIDDERLIELLGFGDGALAVYEALGVDPVRVLD